MALKFKAGDKVRVVKGWDTVNGFTGVVAIASEEAFFPYNVTLDEVPESMSNAVFRENWMMEEDELELVEDWIDFEYKIKGLEEGYWRAIGYGDHQTIREAANLLHTTLHQLADKIVLDSKTEG